MDNYHIDINFHGFAYDPNNFYYEEDLEECELVFISNSNNTIITKLFVPTLDFYDNFLMKYNPDLPCKNYILDISNGIIGFIQRDGILGIDICGQVTVYFKTGQEINKLINIFKEIVKKYFSVDL